MMKQRQTNKYYKRIDKKDKDRGDSSDEETELFVRNKSPKREIPSIEKNIEDGDTLQSLAIHYHCSIEDIKRLNNIHKENEIFARRTIKVPRRPFTEALVGVHLSGKSSPTEFTEPATSKLIDIDSLESKLEQKQEEEDSSKVNQIIFNSSISNKELNRSEAIFLRTEESTNFLPKPDPIISRLSCSGSDWDISYSALVVCIVLLIFAIPLIYVFYIAEHPEMFQNYTDVNDS